MPDSAVARIEVWDRERQLREHRVAKMAREFLRIQIVGAEEIKIFSLKARTNALLTAEKLQSWGASVFCDPILQQFTHAWAPNLTNAEENAALPSFVCEINYLPGVTDNVGRSATEALALVDSFAASEGVQVYSGTAVYLYGEISKSEAERVAQELLGNAVIQSLSVLPWREYNQPARFERDRVPEVMLEQNANIEIFDLHVSDAELLRMSQEHCWALSLAELITIRDYFDRPEVSARRTELKLPVQPTDIEMEILAQTWSEHCKHKIFSAGIEYSETMSPESNLTKLGSFRVESIFKSYIRDVTERVRKERGLDWLISVFSDNAGIVRFDPKIDLCIKVETHNSPSALDPYGGALTGIVGVNRDILGCGMGARPIANTDVFCFAPPDWPASGDEKALPSLLKHPRRIFAGVHRGVEDGGNKSGIPTVNGAFAFDRNFAGKPLVFCGTIGALPPKLNSGKESWTKGQRPGDRIVMAGGRIGKDGIHGATFSSMELTDGAPATVVQIGDPITQKRLADFLLEARDLELFSSVTDNGAGGLSSSVGEMAGLTNGAALDVSLALTKYAGLKPYELVVSESQERMTFSVPPEKLAALLALAARRGVEASDLGQFTDNGEFQIFYQGRVAGMIGLDFLHDGLPCMELKACFSDPAPESTSWNSEQELLVVKSYEMASRSFLEKALYQLLARWNIRTKESWVRRYDHEVQAATIVKPFVGKKAEGPGDAGVIWLAPHGGSDELGIAIGCGLAPKLSRWDCYAMAQHSLDEAVRNCVAVGADPDKLALIDNFCWPDPLPGSKNPDAEHKLAQLVRASRGLYDLALSYGAPFVSGKDSMKNDFIGRTRFAKDIKISIPPTVLITAMAQVPDVSRITSSDFKEAGHSIFVLGRQTRAMAGSELQETFTLPQDIWSTSLPQLNGAENMRLYRKVHKAIREGLLRSCHDCSEGGLLVSVAESCLGGELGLELDLANVPWNSFGGSIWELFFNEAPGRFVVSIAAKDEAKFLNHFAGEAVLPFGKSSQHDVLRITREGLVLVDASLARLRRAWQGDPS